MQLTRYSVFILFVTTIFSCKNNTTTDNASLLITKFSKTILREKAIEKSREIANLPLNTKLIDLHDVSRNAIAIEMEGEFYEEPWIKVAQIDGDTGWVFAASVSLAIKDSVAQQKWLYQLRLQRLGGVVLAKKLSILGENNLDKTISVFPFYTELKLLQDTLNLLLQKKISNNNQGELPDLFWMNDLSPFWIVQTINNRKSYHIFLNFKELSTAAAQSKDLRDDAFFDIFSRIYPQDSIESYVPVWKIMTDDNVFYSQLGIGKHREILQMIATEMPNAEDSKSLRLRQMQTLKEEILADILDKKTIYWNAPEKIKEELLKIMAIKPASFFNNAEHIALETRLSMFEKPLENGIKTNLRTQ
jgi:hypothetical protein